MLCAAYFDGEMKLWRAVVKLKLKLEMDEVED